MISKIRDNLYLSGVKDITDNELLDNKIDVVFNVSNESPNITTRTDVELIKMGFPDTAEDALRFGQESVAKLIELLNSGKKVLVHCRQGKSRSPHVVAMALSKIEDANYYDIYKEVCELHPQTMKYSIGQEWEDKGLI